MSSESINGVRDRGCSRVRQAATTLRTVQRLPGISLPLHRCQLICKTTLLKILTGKRMVGGRDVLRVLDSSAFLDTQLVCSGDLAYLEESWSKTIGSAWRMHKISDGQRRCVQICMGLLHPYKVLLLDEVAVVITIVYATHIFDGLETWATDIAYIQDGELRRSEKLADVQELFALSC